MRVLVFGTKGQVGSELKRILGPEDSVRFASRLEADFTKPQMIERLIEEFRPSHIINAAAYTFVDQAEIDEALAFVVNAEALQVMASCALKVDAMLVHYSTDYVFDGTKTSDYFELSTPNPLNVYGKTKLLGDLSILRQKLNGYVLRVSWVYGNKDHSFLNKIQKQIDNKKTLRVVDDQIGTPTSSSFIAKITRQLIELKNIKPIQIYNLSPKDKCSWFDFAKEYLKFKNINIPIKNIQTHIIQQNANRPKSVKLNSSKLEELLQISFPNWRQVLKDYLHER